jgi:hypothetical protein
MKNPFANQITLTSSVGHGNVRFRWTQATRFHAFHCEVSVNDSEWVKRPSFDATDNTIGDMMRAALR